MKLLSIFVNIREFIVGNFMAKPEVLLKDNSYYNFNNNYLLAKIIKLIPFSFIKILFYYLNYQIIYKQDEIYCMYYSNKTHIIPIIMNFSISNFNLVENLTHKIKYYNSSIPLKFLLGNNNVENFQFIRLKYISKGKIISKILPIRKYLNKPIYTLFEN